MAEPARKKPDGREYRALPSTQTVRADKVRLVESIIAGLDHAQIQDAARLCDQVRRDGRIAGCLRVRSDALLGKPRVIDPAKVRGRVTARAQRVADDLAASFPSMFPRAQLGKLFTWGRMLAIGVGELVWDTQPGAWNLRLKVWHPQYLQWDWHTRKWSIYVEGYEGSDQPVSRYIELPNTSRQVHSDGKWILYTPYGFDDCWLDGLIRPLARHYVGRGWTWNDWDRKNEVYGQGIKQAITPIGGDQVVKANGTSPADRFITSLGKIQSESLIETPQDPATGRGYDFKLHESTNDGAATFGGALAGRDREIGLIILGQNVGAKNESSLGGSVEAQDESVRGDLNAADAETLGECITEQAIYWWTVYNYGSADLKPTVTWDTEPPEDEGAKVQTWVNFGAALPNLHAELPEVDTAKMAEDLGLPMRDPSDMESFEADRAPETLPLEPGGEEALPGAPPVTNGAPPPQATLTMLSEVLDRAVMELAEPSRRRRPLSTFRYPERLARNSSRAAVHLMRDHLRLLMDDIRQAQDAADLRNRIVARFRGLDSDKLASLIEKALILARLGGRHDVLKGL